MAQSRRKFAADCIYEALLQLMRDRPYRQITISDITRRAGVSRMAYYRNYAEKDDILLGHLAAAMAEVEAHIVSRVDLTKKDFWLRLIEASQEDPIFPCIIDAGLFDRAFVMLREMTTRVYTRLYGLDPTDSETVLRICQRLGSLFGCMLFVHEHPLFDKDMLARHLAALAEEDS